MSGNYAILRYWMLALAAAGVLGVAGTTVAAPADGRFNVLTQATRLEHGDTITGMVLPDQAFDVAVILKLRDEEGLQAFIRNVGSSSTPPSQRVMGHAALMQHLPTPAQAQAVADFLKNTGFTHVRISSNRMIVGATGTAAAAELAFRTSLVKVRTHDGREAYANDTPILIPASLRASVQAVLGLQTVHEARPSRPGEQRKQVAGHYPPEFAEIYDASALPPARDINVAVWGWGSMFDATLALNLYASSYGLPPIENNTVCIDYGGQAGWVVIGLPKCGYAVDYGEIVWATEAEAIVAMAGSVKSLTFFTAYEYSEVSLVNTLNEIVTPTVGEPLAQVISGFVQMCEIPIDANRGGDGTMQAMNELFQIGAAQGQTFSMGTGNMGFLGECPAPTGDDLATFPASSPWTVSVSGTTLKTASSQWAGESAWASSGGSPSSGNQAQPWQAPLTYGSHAGERGPDVAFDANPSSGMWVYYGVTGYSEMGSSHLSAGLFAGAWARILEGNPALGFAAPYLYTLPPSVLHDVTSGNDSRFLAQPGWDWVTGLGSFDVCAAAVALQAPGSRHHAR